MGQDLFRILMQHHAQLHNPSSLRDVILRATEQTQFNLLPELFAFLLRRQRYSLVFLVSIGSGDGGEMGMNSLKRRNLYAVARIAEHAEPFLASHPGG